MDEYEDAGRRIVEVLGEPAAREFMTLLESDDTVRADAFRKLYDRGDNDALLDSLHDLEADPVVRGWLVEHLRLELDSWKDGEPPRKPAPRPPGPG